MIPRPEVRYNTDLPIWGRKDDITGAIRENQVIIITGETGSGKTTQIPKMCIEAGRGMRGMIGCTQPRRVAAVTVARRIAEELGQDIGQSVGYKIRFDEKSGSDTLIKIMTDGIMLVETQSDPLLRQYDTIIVDEAHERSLNIDFVLGILKAVLLKRPDLKVIITSATLDTEKFSRAFGNAPIIEVSGRMYAVDVRYRPMDPELEESGEFTYIDAAVDAVAEIRERMAHGDILVFMPTEQDIWEICEILEGRYGDEAAILPLFARLPWHEQQRVFQFGTKTRIIVATNIAETSITIPQIRYVVDTGLARISQYNARSRSTSLPIRAVSRSSADQRKGRCGRVQNGVCIRLYSEEDYLERPLYTAPEILRSNLSGVILQMLYLHLGNIFEFPFIDLPVNKNIMDAVDILLELGAIQKTDKDAQGSQAHPYTLTDQGRIMARLPIDPRVSRMIIEGRKRNCLNDVAVIASALSIVDPRERPANKKSQSDQMHAPFKDPGSDFMTLLRIWNTFHTTLEELKTQNRMRKFCREHFLSYKRMREWRDVYKQITQILEEEPREKSRTSPLPPAQGKPEDPNTAIHKAILSGYLGNIAEKKEKNIYHGTKGREAMIFPGSALFNRGGQWLVAAEMVETSRLYARIVANIEPDWIEEIGKNLCHSSYADPHWEKSREDVLAFEKVTLFGMTIIPKRTVSFSRLHPEEAVPCFIRQGLIPGELKSRFPFLRHNLALIARFRDLENKTRRHDLIDEEAVYRFYAERLPGIANTVQLRKWMHRKGGDGFLFMKEDDMMLQRPDPSAMADYYPDQAVVGGMALPLTYRFEPGHNLDGIALKVPAGLLPNLSVSSLDWAVPGILREKIYNLLRGLPKELRKKLPPLPHVCDTMMEEMPRGESSLLNAMGRFIHDRFDVSIPMAAWSDTQIPEHLKMVMMVVDGKDQILSTGRDLRNLQKNIGAVEESAAFEKACRIWEKTGLIEWTFGDLPETVILKNNDLPVGVAYPALEADASHSVNLRLFKNRAAAMASHPFGVGRLYEIRYADDMHYLRKTLVLSGDWKKWAEAFGGSKVMESLLYQKVAHDLFHVSIRTQSAFIEHAEKTCKKILSRGAEILNLASPAVQAYWATMQSVDRFEKVHTRNKIAGGFIRDIRDEIRMLLPDSFLIDRQESRLPDIIRYLRAYTIRLERGLVHLEKAFIKTAELNIYKNKYNELHEGCRDFTTPERKSAVGDLFWMVEEFKVSLFAQELKTPYPISRKRLDDKIKEIEMMD